MWINWSDAWCHKLSAWSNLFVINGAYDLIQSAIYSLPLLIQTVISESYIQYLVTLIIVVIVLMARMNETSNLTHGVINGGSVLTHGAINGICDLTHTASNNALGLTNVFNKKSLKIPKG